MLARRHLKAKAKENTPSSLLFPNNPTCFTNCCHQLFSDACVSPEGRQAFVFIGRFQYEELE